MHRSLRNWTLITLFSLVASLDGLAQQELIGLWEVESVMVGDQQMTPVARWTRIHEDGTLESGNGWLQNFSGTYTYDADARTFMPDNPLGPEDPAGPFTVSFEGDKMIWERQEDGMNVKVVSGRRDELPMTPADLLNGLWVLQQIKRDGTKTEKEVPGEWKSVYIGWDRIYRARNSEGNRITGYWHMNAHRPELVILPHTENEEPVTWRVEVDETTLRLFGISGSVEGVEQIFERRRTWPD